MGIIGGGKGSFIGRIHRMAAALCEDIELVAGAFSSDPAKSRQFGDELFLAPERVYASHEDMLSNEARFDESNRLDFVVIATPNHLHYDAAKLALQAGFGVLCDKPVTRTLEEAYSLRELVMASGQRFGLTHGYLGYPLVSQAREMVTRGEFGTIRKVLVEYLQGWLSDRQEVTGNKQASWRTDPERTGSSGCIADIGTHAHSLAEYIAGQTITRVSADLTTFVKGRKVDDDGSALFQMSAGAKGVLTASQVCTGAENGLKISVFGSKGGCEWRQEEPNSLFVRRPGESLSVYRAGTGVPYLYPEVQASGRAPSGHPEGLLEAFAHIYRSYAELLWQDITGLPNGQSVPACPDIDAGVRGMEFIEAMVSSSSSGGQWTQLRPPKSVAHLSPTPTIARTKLEEMR